MQGVCISNYWRIELYKLCQNSPDKHLKNSFTGWNFRDMKIVHLVLGKARLDRMNGINKVAHNLALYQTRLGTTAEIWGITPTPEDQPAPRPYALRLYHNRTWGLDPQLVQALKTLEPGDRVHLHGSFIPAFRLIAERLVRQGTPYVYCPHGSLSPGALARSKWKKQVYLHLREMKMLRHAAAIHLLGETQYHHLQERLPGLPYHLVPNGQNLEELAFEPKIIKRPGELLFSFCGRLDADHKGLDLLLNGLSLFRHRGGQAHIWLIGGGGDEGMLRRLVDSLGLQEFVHFLGPQFGSQKLALLAKSDVFVHTSRYEGLPTAVLEAAGLGLPCLVSGPTNMGGALERHTAGWLLPRLHAEAVADAMEAASAARERGDWPEYGQRAHYLIKTEYNWLAIARATLEMYGTQQAKAG